MTTFPEMRDLAERLLTYEANAGNISEPVESTTLRVYEKLRQSLVQLTGAAGFHALGSRALMLARSEVPSLSAVELAADGSLQGMSATEHPINVEEDRVRDGGVILISRLLGLLVIFLGEALMMNLVRDVWPDAASDDGNPQDGRKA